jgi:hypothetical protein
MFESALQTFLLAYAAVVVISWVLIEISEPDLIEMILEAYGHLWSEIMMNLYVWWWLCGHIVMRMCIPAIKTAAPIILRAPDPEL